MITRTLIDLAPHLNDKDLARAVRAAVRLRTTSPSDLFVALNRHRGTRRLYTTVSRYAQLPLNRTRSDAEALPLTLLEANPRLCPEVFPTGPAQPVRVGIPDGAGS